MSTPPTPAERWRPAPDFPDYEVSDRGRVRRATPSRRAPVGYVLTPGRVSDGYLQFGLRRDRETHYAYAHRLVASAFIPNPENRRTVDHLDGDPENNAVENLEWVSYSENLRRAYRNGRRRRGDVPAKVVRAIREAKGSQQSIAARYGVSQPYVSAVRSGQCRAEA